MKLTVNFPSRDYHGAEIVTLEKVTESRTFVGVWDVQLVDGRKDFLFSDEILVSA